MTTIITDGKSMAADRRASFSGRAYAVTKIDRIKSEIVGIAGCHAYGKRLLKWYKKGANFEKFPDDKGTDWEMLIINEKGINKVFTHAILKVDFKYVAIGCGQDFALSAAYLGKNLEESIEFASVHDIDTGMGVDILHLKDKT